MEISIEHLNKNYGKQNVLKDISLHIPIGMYGMLGENGAGKTTLMRILATLSEPTTGMVEINGIDIKRKKEIRKIIGYLPQEFSIYPNMTVYSALDYLGILAELPNNIRKRRINELLKQVNLEQEKNKRFKNLSGGMKRRLGIAQAFIGNPKVIIVDEPTTGLDPEERIRFRNILSEVSDKDVIIILSTHIVGDISSTCKKLALLNKGQLKFEGSPDDMIELAKGKVWEIFVTNTELQEIKEKYPIISTIPSDGGWEIQVVAEGLDDYSGKPVMPNIEHAYVYFMDYLLKDKMDMYSEKIGGDLFQ